MGDGKRETLPDGGGPADWSAFAVTVRVLGEKAWVSVEGELDLATAPQLEATLDTLRDRVDGFAFDLSEVTFIDLAGLRPILEESLSNGHSSIRSVSRVVSRLLDLLDIELPLTVGCTGQQD